MVRNARAAAYEARPEALIAVGNAYPSGHFHAMHRHERHQFLYSATGIMIVGTEQGTWVVPPQCAIWIPAGISHEIRMVGLVTTRSIYLKDRVLERSADRCQVLSVPRLLRRLLIEAVDLPLAYGADDRANIIVQLILNELRAAPELPLCVPIPSQRRLEQMCRRFLCEPRAQQTIDSWASELNMSRRAFTRMFRQETGMSLVAWQQRACVFVALSRLASGEAVTTVAIDCGYATPASFTSMFRKVMGVAPSHYCADADDEP